MYLKRFQHLYDCPRPRIAEFDNVTLRLQRNEKPDDWGDELYDLAFANAPEFHLQRYPDPLPFYGKLSRFLNLPEKNLVVTSGIDEPIRTLMTLCCDTGDSIAVPSHTYAMYDVYPKLHGVGVNHVEYRPGDFMSPDALMEKIDGETRILFLPNPSQPVENVYDLKQMRHIAEKCREKGVLLVVDEAYHFFGAETAMPLIDEFENVLIMRTFSKAFGAASIRLGFVAGSDKALGPLAAFRLAHESNSLSLYVAGVLLDNFETLVKKNIESICSGRDYLRQACLNYGLQAWGEVGNFVLIVMEDADRKKMVCRKLSERGIHVKGGFGPPLDRHILVTCGHIDMMSVFFDSLRDILESGPNR